MSERSTVRRILPPAVLAAALLVLGAYLMDDLTRPALLTGPMVQIPEPRTIAVCWRARTSFQGGWVKFAGPDGAERMVPARSENDRYEARLEALEPGVPYTYTLYHQGFPWRKIALSGPHEVRSPPPRSQPFRFIAFGDSGNGSNTQSALVEVMVEQDPDLAIHVGDLVYPSGAAADYPLIFFEPNAPLIRSVPFMPSLGNHDVATASGQPLLDVFLLPENGPEGIQPERNYFFDFGDARFVALDTNPTETRGIVSAEEMKRIVAPWLRQVLTDGDARWRFVFFHHPFYTGSKHSAEDAAYVKHAFVDVFEEAGVDIVFCGHNHLYERTAPINQDRIVADGDGVVYITTGAGGVSRYPERETPPEYMRAYNDKVFSFTCVDVSGERLELRQIDEGGRVIDEYTIAKPRRATLRHPGAFPSPP